MTLYFTFKRVFDIVGAISLLIILWPFVAMSAFIIWFEDPTSSPILGQERIGCREKSFTLWKLRTMRFARFEGDRKLTDSERLLRSGRYFRKMSIDELPQLWNVLKGDMSFIGPRPMPITYLQYFRPNERIRHTIRPGMSGLAQVKGRNFLTWDEKFAFDVSYVEQLSFLLDVKIFFLSIMKVIVPVGVGVRGEDLPTISLFDERKPWVDIE
jgi:lipopolysaccharide/colanic/teichoic acid biosynthesis glycosyltransferase